MENTTNEILKNFLNDNNIQSATIDRGAGWGGTYKKLFYKINIQKKFDFVYCCELGNDVPRIDGDASKNEFCGVIDRDTKKLYFVRYELYNYFDNYHNPDGEPLQFVKYEDIVKLFNDAIIAKYDEMAETVADDMTPSEDNIYYINSDAPNNFYYDKANQYKYTPGTSNQRTSAELLQFITDPAQAVAKAIKDQEQNDDESKRPANAIKYNKMMQRLENEKRHEIETAPEFARLRQAKEIKKAIPEGANQINFVYLLNNGEIISGKIDARTLQTMPYYTGDATHFSAWNVDKPTRDKITEINGREYDEVYLKNIIKLTYKGKTIYSNPEHNTKEGA